jgi:acyl carrier protein
MDYLAKIKKTIEDTEDLYTHKATNDISADDKIINDLGIDSLGRVTLFYELTHEFKINEDSIDESTCQNWETVNDIIEFLKENTDG